jgi:hypothetical protein
MYGKNWSIYYIHRKRQIKREKGGLFNKKVNFAVYIMIIKYIGQISGLITIKDISKRNSFMGGQKD